MTDTDIPRTDWLDLAVMSQSDDDFEDQWGTILDEENFRRLDRETIVSGSIDDRPDRAPHDGAKYHATDSNVVYTWDEVDGEWRPLNSGTAGSPVPGTSHFETLSTDSITIDGDVVDDVGRLAEGGLRSEHAYVVSEADGTYYARSERFPDYVGESADEVLQRASDELEGARTHARSDGTTGRTGGGDVFVTNGEYEIQRTVTVGNGVRVVGVQPDVASGRTDPESTYCVFRPGADLPADAPLFDTAAGEGDVGFHNFAIDGEGAPNYGIELSRGTGSTFTQNVVVARLDRPGLWANGSQDTWVSQSSVEDCGNATHPAVLVEDSTDSSGTSTTRTRIQWHAGRISNESGNTALAFESASARIYDATLEVENASGSGETAVVEHGGTDLEISRCRIDAHHGAGTVGVVQTENNHLRIADSAVRRTDVGLLLDGNQDSSLDSVRVRDVGSVGIHVKSNAGQWDRVDVRDVDGTGVVVDGSNVNNRWSNLRIWNWDRDDAGAPAIDVRGVKGGKPGDVPVIDGLDLGGASPAESIANPHLCVVDGQWVRPYTYSLGGSDGSIDVSSKPASPVHVRVDAGSAAATLEGIDGPTASTTVIVEHAGSEPVTLANAAAVARPLLNQDGTDTVLDGNGQQACYRYDAQSGAWRQAWVNTQ